MINKIMNLFAGLVFCAMGLVCIAIVFIFGLIAFIGLFPWSLIVLFFILWGRS